MNLKFLNKNTTRWKLQAGFNVAVIVKIAQTPKEISFTCAMKISTASQEGTQNAVFEN